MSSMSERIKQKTRRKRLHRLKQVVTVLLVLSVCYGSWQWIHRPDFSCGGISISGTRQLTVEEVLALAEAQPPVNLLTLDRDRLEEALSHDVRFQRVSTEYVWPGVLQIHVEERKPALYLQNAHKNYIMVDYRGLVMNVTCGVPSDNAPILLGKQCGDLFVGDQVTDKDVLSLISFLEQVGPEAVEEFAEILVTPEQKVHIQLRDGLTIIFGSMAEAAAKAGVFNPVYEEIKNKHLAAKYIDFTYAKPYVKLDEKLAPKLLEGVNQ